MLIHTLIKKGVEHAVFCEDFLLSMPLEEYGYVGAVFDGCSSGKDTHFASTLLAKVFRKIASNTVFHKDLKSIEVAKFILQEAHQELKFIQQKLRLEINELLATIILVVYNQTYQDAFIILLGDGVVEIDDSIHSFDQNNMPDYFAYHLDVSDFDSWFNNQSQTILIAHPKKISISSDGILSFRSFKTDMEDDINPVSYLLTDTFLEDNPSMLNRKFNILEKKYGYQPADDVSIIRIKFQ